MKFATKRRGLNAENAEAEKQSQILRLPTLETHSLIISAVRSCADCPQDSCAASMLLCANAGEWVQNGRALKGACCPLFFFCEDRRFRRERERVGEKEREKKHIDSTNTKTTTKKAMPPDAPQVYMMMHCSCFGNTGTFLHRVHARGLGRLVVARMRR